MKSRSFLDPFQSCIITFITVAYRQMGIHIVMKSGSLLSFCDLFNHTYSTPTTLANKEASRDVALSREPKILECREYAQTLGHGLKLWNKDFIPVAIYSR